MLKHIKNNWLTIATALIGLFVAWYFFDQSERKGEIYVIVEEKPVAVILSSHNTKVADLKVLHKGEKIKGDVYAYNFWIWNNGREPIEKKDILKDISISLSGGRILGVVALNCTHPDIVNPTNEIEDTKLNIGFDILDINQGIRGQMIIERIDTISWLVQGYIKGVGDVRSEYTAGKFKSATINVLSVIGAISIFFGGILGFSWVFEKIEARAKKKGASLVDRILMRVTQVFGLFFALAFIGMLLISLYAGLVEAYTTLRPDSYIPVKF